jgi:hypothetical protein
MAGAGSGAATGGAATFFSAGFAAESPVVAGSFRMVAASSGVTASGPPLGTDSPTGCPHRLQNRLFGAREALHRSQDSVVNSI